MKLIRKAATLPIMLGLTVVAILSGNRGAVKTMWSDWWNDRNLGIG